MKQPIVYIMANKKNGTIYIGVTSDLAKRIYEHKEGLAAGFTKKYCCKLLVFYEICGTMEAAIVREKQIKGFIRKKKINLVESIIQNGKIYMMKFFK